MKRKREEKREKGKEKQNEGIKQKKRETWRGRKEKGDAVGLVLHFRERTSSFSLESWEIRPLDFFKTRKEVVLHGEDNAWTPVFGSFFNFQEVGYFPTRFIFSLKAL